MPLTGNGMDADAAPARQSGFALHPTNSNQIGDREKVRVLAKPPKWKKAT